MKNCKTYIHEVAVMGDWESFILALPNWKQLDDNRFTDGVNIFRQNAKQFSFELEVHDFTQSDEIVTSPGGITIPVRREKTIADNFSLNHIAVSVKSIPTEREWWEDLFDCREVLYVEQGWDPLIDGPLTALHLYRENQLYVTLRQDENEESQVHHFGFEVKHNSDIEYTRKILNKIGWKIEWEGVIDNSLVLHFRGPDGLVHDVFCTEKFLRRKRKSNSA